MINALTDEFHPCQILADLQTIAGVAGELAGLTLTFLGDGSSNMAHSYLLGGATAGMHVRICGPEGFGPSPTVTGRARRRSRRRTGGSVGFGSDPDEACKGADFLATDVWTSMGQEGQEDERIAAMTPFAWTRPSWPRPARLPGVLHCLPAHRGQEITAEVIDGPASLVFDQAENRLHAQKALLAWLMSEPGAAA